MQKNNLSKIVYLIFVLIVLTNLVGAVTIQDYEPSFYLYNKSTDRLLIEHFENYNSTLINGGTPNENNYVSGRIGNAFDCNSSSINYGNNFDFTTQDFTIEVWIKTTSSEFNVTWGKHIVGKHENGESGAYVLSYNKNSDSGLINFKASQLSPSQYLWDITSTRTVNDGEWHHVAAVRDYSDTSKGIKIYVDGDLDVEGIQTQGSITNDFDFTICSDNDGDENYFTGQVDEVIITNAVKSAEEIKADALLYPDNGTSFSTSVLSLNWTNATDLDNDLINYTVQISDDSAFSNLIVNQTNVIDNNFTTPTLNSNTYFWRIRPLNILTGMFSNVKSFIINNLLPIIFWINPNNDINYVPIYRTSGFTQNISFSDDHLYQYNCTIYSDAAMTNPVWSVQTIIEGNTTYDESSIISTTTWHGAYYENCSVSDI